ncbi:MAG TPA: NADH-quinone oxidoreductase subunit L, partial [Nitrososphaerales archaeon]|nr:NADH-quinone oxidoreductase subunit L [Nitrososphaerales archaeon]
LTFTHPYSESLGFWILNPYTNVSLQVNVDGFSVLLSAFVAFLSFVIIVYAVENMRKEEGQAKFYSLVLLFVGAMLGLIMAGNLVQLYFFWEIVGICSALLISFWSDREAARKAGLKAFVVTRFGDVALLIAVVLTLTMLHTTDFASIISAVHTQGINSTWFLIGVLVLIGAMGKSAQVPLHVWLPDAMEGPTPVSALIHAATMVNAGVYLIVRLSPIYLTSSLLSTIVLVVGLVSMAVGAICACAEQDLKRILAYSTISQLGLMFAAVGLGTSSGAVYQLISQGLFKALAFMAAGSVIEVIGTRNIENMGGLRGVMKYSYIGFLFAMLAMVGLPPLIGFWTKDLILTTALTTNNTAFLIIVLASLLTSFYSFRALIKVFHGKAKTDAKESPPLMIIPMMVLVVSVITGWLVLNYQKIFLPPLSLSIDGISLATTLLVLAAGLAISYIAFQARSEAERKLVTTSALLGGVTTFLRQGMEFDRLYSGLAKYFVGALVRGAKAIQTGILESNLALLFSALVIVILLIATGVI